MTNTQLVFFIAGALSTLIGAVAGIVITQYWMNRHD